MELTAIFHRKRWEIKILFSRGKHLLWWLFADEDLLLYYCPLKSVTVKAGRGGVDVLTSIGGVIIITGVEQKENVKGEMKSQASCRISLYWSSINLVLWFSMFIEFILLPSEMHPCITWFLSGLKFAFGCLIFIIKPYFGLSHAFSLC